MAASMSPEEFDLMPAVADVVRHHGRTRPGHAAMSFEGRHTDYATLDAHTNQIAQALIAAGVKPGEGVAFFGKNSDLYFEIFFGAAKARAFLAPVGWRLAANEVAYAIDLAQAKIVFVGAECAPCLAEALGQTSAKPLVIAMEAGAHDYPLFEPWRDRAPAIDPALPAASDDTVLLLFTSGTTGRPKGVMISNGNLLRSRRAMAENKLGWNEWEAGEVNYVAMPIAHIGGTGWGFVGLLNGVKNVIAREFNPMEALECIERERIAKMFMVPAALQFAIRQPRAREIDYSSLRVILYGASPMPVALLRECIEIFGCDFCQQYGMTETAGTIVYLPPADHDRGSNAACPAPAPLPGVELRILDAAGNPPPRKCHREIATRSGWLSRLLAQRREHRWPIGSRWMAAHWRRRRLC
ncbi:MAG: AMP-binding protein [Hyphomonadaceae bacterium]